MDTETQESVAGFAKRHGITAEVERITSRPDTDDAWDTDARHFVVTLHDSDRTMEVPFSQGSAHTQDPTVEDVLDCLASDIQSVSYYDAADEDDWMDWAESMAMLSDAESVRRARKMWRDIQSQTERLQYLLGSKQALEALVFKTERL